MEKPNILFLMCDEQRFDVLGYAGNPIIRTPVLDSLAARAVVFENAYTPSPICIPARQCLMSGQFPKNCNCLEYSDDLAPGYMTFARYLSFYGYETVACGKLHHMGQDQMQGWTTRIGGDTEIAHRYIALNDDIEIIKDKSGTGKWTNSQEIKRAGVGSNCKSQTADAFALEGALNFIKNRFVDPYYDRPNIHQPLLLKISFNRPHYPYYTSEKAFNYYLNRVPIYCTEPALEHPFLNRHRVRVGQDVSEREIRRATAAYYGMIEQADTDFGKIIKALEDVGQNIDDWIVIYTGDHGEMLGQHGVWEKQQFFEASVRVPLFIRYPKKYDAHKVDKNVSLCDLFATLCDLTDLPVPSNLDSRTLLPFLENIPHTKEPDNEVISHFKDMGGYANLMIKRNSLKYQYYGESATEVLFDLNKNPQETINYLNEKKYAPDVKAFRLRKHSLGY